MAEVSLFYCPRCQLRCIREPHSGDFQHQCQSSSEALKNEDIIVLGAWTDYTGSSTQVQQALLKGQENTLDGTRAGIEGAKFIPRTSRGFPVTTFRTRQHIEHTDESKFKQKSPGQANNPEFYEDDHEQPGTI